MEIFDVIKTRRSIRSYKPDQIADDKLNKVLDAARLAPSAANRQPFKFIVIKNAETKKGLMPAYTKEWFWEAPVIICACTVPNLAWVREDGKNYAEVDVAIAMDHLVLAATGEGLGTCWVAAFKALFIKENLLNCIDENLEPIALTPLGYPKEMPEARGRKAFGDVITII